MSQKTLNVNYRRVPPTLEAIHTYMLKHEWVPEPGIEGWTLFNKTFGSGSEREDACIEVPDLDRAYIADYVPRVSEVLNSLAIHEGRSMGEVYDDIVALTVQADDVGCILAL
jgi:hypothetical protein